MSLDDNLKILEEEIKKRIGYNLQIDDSRHYPKSRLSHINISVEDCPSIQTIADIAIKLSRELDWTFTLHPTFKSEKESYNGFSIGVAPYRPIAIIKNKYEDEEQEDKPKKEEHVLEPLDVFDVSDFEGVSPTQYIHRLQQQLDSFRLSKVSIYDNEIVVRYHLSILSSEDIDELHQLLEDSPVPVRYKPLLEKRNFLRQLRQSVPSTMDVVRIKKNPDLELVEVSVHDENTPYEQVEQWRKGIQESINQGIVLSQARSGDRVINQLRKKGVISSPSELAPFIQGIKPTPFTNEYELPKVEYEDLTDLICFSIDPKRSWDLDDAISIEQKGDGSYRLGVHIADASSFVLPNSELDIQAREYGFSAYGITRERPMLPPELAHGKISLLPDQERLAFSVLMNIDQDGKVQDYQIKRTKIRNRKKLSYREARGTLQGYRNPFEKEIFTLEELADKLRSQRKGIRHQENYFEEDSSILVEEPMILANRLVAEFLKSSEKPGIYRVHKKRKLSVIKQLLDEKGIDPKDMRGVALSDALHSIFTEHPESREEIMKVINGRARYSTQNTGHHELGFQTYTHFTSPIRRYADLLVHRQLSHILYRTPEVSSQNLSSLLSHLNKRENEIEAESAEIAYVDKISQDVENIGQEFETKLRRYRGKPDVKHKGRFAIVDLSNGYRMHRGQIRGPRRLRIHYGSTRRFKIVGYNTIRKKIIIQFTE